MLLCDIVFEGWQLSFFAWFMTRRRRLWREVLYKVTCNLILIFSCVNYAYHLCCCIVFCVVLFFKLIVLTVNCSDQTVSLYDVPGTVCHDYKSS